MTKRGAKSSNAEKVLGIDLAAQPDNTYACTLEARGRTLKATIHPKCDDNELIALGKRCKKVAIDAPFG